jgi:two-component system LytT family sensor kinase
VTRLAVPSFLLQPLVENSIKHAIGKSEAGGTIRISASASDKMIRIAVEDSGSGDPDQDLQSSAEDGPEGTGVGLRNTRERLKNLYGDRSTVELARSMLGGLRINISIPAVEVLQYD